MTLSGCFQTGPPLRLLDRTDSPPRLTMSAMSRSKVLTPIPECRNLVGLLLTRPDPGLLVVAPRLRQASTVGLPCDL